MNYIWQFLLNGQEQGVNLDTIRFQIAKSYSPYTELAFSDLNQVEIENGQTVEINPFYRFYDIFKDMYLEEMVDYEELKDGLFHLIIHFIARNDMKQGMNREEYYKKFLYEDIKQGYFGENTAQNIKLFDIKERNLILHGLIKMYRVGNSLDLLKSMIVSIFDNAIIYNNAKYKNEIIIYIGKKMTKELEQKVQLVLELFANIRYEIELYYEYHFAVLGVDATVSIDEIALY